jgi:hypothetical protein
MILKFFLIVDANGGHAESTLILNKKADLQYLFPFYYDGVVIKFNLNK